MIIIHPLTRLDPVDFERVATGYVSNQKYAVVYTDSDHHTTIDLQLVALQEPYVKAYDYSEAETLQHYAQLLPAGYSFGAYDGNLLVGLLIAEVQHWNQSVWVREFHVAATHRAQGIGKRLMEQVVEKARTTGLRIIVCETQTTNVVAIQVYRRLGFRLEGVDLSYYSNGDFPAGEMAVFMKRKLT